MMFRGMCPGESLRNVRLRSVIEILLRPLAVLMWYTCSVLSRSRIVWLLYVCRTFIFAGVLVPAKLMTRKWIAKS
jgi:hypothetical protein